MFASSNFSLKKPKRRRNDCFAPVLLCENILSTEEQHTNGKGSDGVVIRKLNGSLVVGDEGAAETGVEIG